MLASHRLCVTRIRKNTSKRNRPLARALARAYGVERVDLRGTDCKDICTGPRALSWVQLSLKTNARTFQTIIAQRGSSTIPSEILFLLPCHGIFWVTQHEFTRLAPVMFYRELYDGWCPPIISAIQKSDGILCKWKASSICVPTPKVFRYIPPIALEPLEYVEQIFYSEEAITRETCDSTIFQC